MKQQKNLKNRGDRFQAFFPIFIFAESPTILHLYSYTAIASPKTSIIGSTPNPGASGAEVLPPLFRAPPVAVSTVNIWWHNQVARKNIRGVAWARCTAPVSAMILPPVSSCYILLIYSDRFSQNIHYWLYT